MSTSLYIPDAKQNTTYDCGAVCVQLILAYYGIEKTEVQIEKALKTDKDYGTEISDIKNFFRRGKFKFFAGSLTEKQAKNFIRRKIPIIILFQAWAPEGVKYSKHITQWGHYAIISGYNSKGWIIEDPWIFGRGFISYRRMAKQWHACDDRGKLISNFGIAAWGKRPYDYKSLYPIG
jgi:ABC-type bacteriocin/lantibiotic exporter with double-glycine peptidase domain